MTEAWGCSVDLMPRRCWWSIVRSNASLDPNPRYVMRITGDNDEGTFQKLESLQGTDLVAALCSFEAVSDRD